MRREADRQHAQEPVTISTEPRSRLGRASATGEREGEVQMGAMPSRAQSVFYKGLLPIELSVEAPAVFTADLKNDRFADGQPSARKEATRPLARFLVPFYI